jgi:hypothetical protein
MYTNSLKYIKFCVCCVMLFFVVSDAQHFVVVRYIADIRSNYSTFHAANQEA